MIEKLKEYITNVLKERDEIFLSLQANNMPLSLSPSTYKANTITHGVNLLLNFLEAENVSLDFLTPLQKEEREKYNYFVNNFNSPEVQKFVKPIIEKLQNEKKL